MDIRRGIPKLYIDDAYSVRNKGPCGSGQTTLGSITAGSNILKVTNQADFIVGQSIIITNAGATTNLSTPTLASSSTVGQGVPGALTIAGGSPGTYTYGYRVAAVDANGGVSSASTETLVNNCELNLTDPLTQSYKAFYLSVWPLFPTNAVSLAIYRTTVPSGSRLTTGYVGQYCYGGSADIGYADIGLPVVTPPNGIPVTPPNQPLGGYLVATIQNIQTVNGSTQFTLSTIASNPVSGVLVYHDDSPVIQAALNTGSPKVYFPSGHYVCANTLHCNTDGQILYGDGANSVISFVKTSYGVSVETSDVTVRDLTVDGNRSTIHALTTEFVPSGTPIHDLTIQGNRFINALQMAMFIGNPNTDQWQRISIRNNTAIDTLNGYWVQGPVQHVSVTDNKMDWTQYNYSGRGICLRNFGAGTYVKQATVTGNIIRCGNHTSAVTIQGSGEVTVTGNVLMVAGGIFAIYCDGDGTYEEQTDMVTVTGNHMEALWPEQGVAVAINNYKLVTVNGNVMRNFGQAFNITPFSGAIADSLNNGVRINDNLLYQISAGAIANASNAKLSVRYEGNFGLNPMGPITPSANPLISGTAYLNSSSVDITIYQQVYAATTGTDGNVVISLGPSSSPSTLFTKYVSGNSTSVSPEVVTLRVPQGWYYRFTTSGATIGTTAIIGD